MGDFVRNRDGLTAFPKCVYTFLLILSSDSSAPFSNFHDLCRELQSGVEPVGDVNQHSAKTEAIQTKMSIPRNQTMKPRRGRLRQFLGSGVQREAWACSPLRGLLFQEAGDPKADATALKSRRFSCGLF